MRHGDAAVRYHDCQIPQIVEARVPGDTQDDDRLVEVPSFEHIVDRDEPLHLFVIACHPRVCTRAVGRTLLDSPLVSRRGCSPSMLTTQMSKYEKWARLFPHTPADGSLFVSNSS